MIPDGMGDLFARVNQIQGLLDQLNPEVAPTQSQSPTSTGSFQQALQAVLQPADPAAVTASGGTAGGAASTLAAAAGLPLALPTTAPLATPRTAPGTGFEVGLPSAAVAREVLRQDRAVPATGTTSSSSPRSVGSSKAPTVPAAYRRLVKEACQKYGVDESLVLAVMQTESDFNPRCVSSAGAMGLLQLMPENCRELGVSDPFDPAQNIDGGVRELKKMLETFGGDVKLALAGYNAGPNAVKRYGGVPPYRETQDYIPKVLRRQEAFQEDLPALTPPPAATTTAAMPAPAATSRSAAAPAASGQVAPLPVGPKLTGRPTKGESAASIERALQAAADDLAPAADGEELPVAEAPAQPAVTVTRRETAGARRAMPPAAESPAPEQPASTAAPASAPAASSRLTPPAELVAPTPPPAPQPAPPSNPPLPVEPAPRSTTASSPPQWQPTSSAADGTRRLPTASPRHLLGPRDSAMPRPAVASPTGEAPALADQAPVAPPVGPAANVAPTPAVAPAAALGEAVDSPLATADAPELAAADPATGTLAPRRATPRAALPGVAEVVSQTVREVVEPLAAGVRSLATAIAEPPAEALPPAEPPAVERRLPAEAPAPRQERDNHLASSQSATAAPGATAPVSGSETPTPDREQRPPRSAERVTSVPRNDETNDAAPVFSVGETARSTAPRAAERPSAALVADNPREVTQQVAGQARLLRSPGSDQFTVEVRHPEAGQVAIRVLRDASGVHVTMQTSHEGLRREMQQQLPALQEALREHGLALGSFDVGRRDQQQPQPQQQPLPHFTAARHDSDAVDPDPQPQRLARASTPSGSGTLAEWA